MKRNLIIAVIALLACSCQDNSNEKAASLLDEARQAAEEKNFDVARELIDSIRETYPKAIDVRYETLTFENEMERDKASLEHDEVDSLLAYKTIELDELKKEFRLEKDSKYQTVGYYVIPEQIGSLMHKTALRAEVNEEGEMILISILHGKKISHKSIKVATKDGLSAETPECFSHLTHKVKGYEEESSYKLGEDGGVIEFIVNNPGTIDVTYIGTSNVSTPLTPSDKSAIKSCYALANKFKEVKELTEKRNKLALKKKFYERKLLEDVGKSSSNNEN